MLASVVGLAPSAGGSSGSEGEVVGSPPWREAKWPFLMDQWGTGRAFQCAPADCGVALTLYVRPKIGFCNCTSGVSDDAELDRVGDVELIAPHFMPLAEGHAIAVGHMNGRSRAYSFASRDAALAVAFNDKCDVVVATVTANGPLPENAEAHALAFLNSQPVLHWVEVSLGL